MKVCGLRLDTDRVQSGTLYSWNPVTNSTVNCIYSNWKKSIKYFLRAGEIEQGRAEKSYVNGKEKWPLWEGRGSTVLCKEL